ncbi:MAG: porin, partial [Planctomycetota bacterium]
MKLFWRTSLGLVLAMAFMTNVAKAEAKADTSLENEVEHYLTNNTGQGAEPNTFRVYWDKGLRMKSGDGNFSIKFGGRAQFDMVWADSDDNASTELGENEVGFRRVRLYFSGSVYKNTLFKVQIDFADTAQLRDVYVGLNKIGPGKLLFGHFKEPFSLNELTSSKYITFTERAASVQAFAPSRNSGLAWFGNFGETKRIYLAAGTFFNTNGVGRVAGQGGWGFSVRIGGLAIENKDRDMLLWVAFNFRWSNYRMSDRGVQEVRYRSRVDSFGTRQINTGDLSAESDIRYAFEVAFKIKSIHIQAEFFFVTTKMVNDDDPDFFGWYAQVGWFITGESRKFKKTSGSWSRTSPKANFWTGEGGRGA